MKIQQWLGFNEEASQYALRTGELRSLVNLQTRRPGMLVSRPGLVKLYGKYDDEVIAGIYRRDTLVGDPNDYLCFQKSVVDRILTAAQIDAGTISEETAWIVRRIQGYQERVIAQLPLSPEGTEITNFCVCEDRHGRLFLFFGHGAEPLMYRPGSLANNAISMGMDSPLVAPVIVPDGQGYFIETIDVTSGGGGYYAPPTITIDGGNPDRPARVKGIVQSGNLVGIDVIDGGANYKTFPKITVATDKVGAGFRAVGNLETDPGVQGFVSTTAGTISGTSPSADETVGETNSVLNNRIMYRTSEVTATTKTVSLASPLAAPPSFVPDIPYPQETNVVGSTTRYMMLESVSGIQPGDIITIQATSQPAPFGPTAVVRVIGIDSRAQTMESKTVRVIEISKQWTPAANTSYTVQFRRDTDVGYAAAEWNETKKRFRASVPLRTLRGNGRGAEATLEFAPAAYTYGIGAFNLGGYTLPTGGVGPSQFGFQLNGWDSYINGDYWGGSQQNKKDSAENRTYAGLQASGSSYVFGYSGTVSTQERRRLISRRADVYWPDYSKISVWLNVGQRLQNASQWVRVDADVIDGNTANPYAIIELRPALDNRQTAQTGRLSSGTVPVGAASAGNVVYPKIRINLVSCPDSWVTSDKTNGSYDYNLPFSVKEATSGRLAWWHSSATTPRPVVDVRRDPANPNQIAWDAVEVIDPGSGWANGTSFLMRIHQANAYDQRTDLNTAVREPKISAAHKPFSTTTRFVQLGFLATEPDSQTPAGPPNALAGSQFVDVAGTGYRSGDQAAVTVLKRKLASGAAENAVTFEGVLASSGRTTEFTTTSGVQNAGATITNITSSASQGRINAGDIISCDTEGVLLSGSYVLRKSGSSILLDKMHGVYLDSDATIFGINYITPTDRLIKLVTDGTGATARTTANQFWNVGQKLLGGGTTACRITEVFTSGSEIYAKVAVESGAFNAGVVSYLPVFSFTAVSGVVPAQTVTFTAEQIAAGTGEQRVTSIRIVSGGRDYFSSPSVLVRGGGNGYGLAVNPIVDGGKITACEITDPGRAYTVAPELYTNSSAATAVPVMRPTMRGKYRCAYRFVDRSETEILSDTITGIRGDTPTTLTLSSTVGVEPGMLLESDRVPSGTKVVSVNGNQVNLNQPATGVGLLGVIVMENPGSGYGATEVPTVTVAGAVGAVLTPVMATKSDGTRSVASVSVTTKGTTLFDAKKIPVTFSAPENGGSVATGYAIITQFDTAETYTKSVLVRDPSKPTSYSNFSPIIDIDAGPNDERTHCSEFKWTLPGVTPPSRADRVELWRTSADQSLVFYRLEAYGIPSDSGVEIVGKDTLNDEELFDPDRPNYAAMPVVLPNGNLNAYRFGKPRKDMSVCVAFQDRLWHGVSTSGKDANTLFYSEFDEFESCPDANDLPIQNNQRATDSLTALVPYGSMLLAMQSSHTYSITYNTDPAVDGAIQMLTHRGCLHQRCWDMNNSVFYAVDESGIYSMDRSGNIMDISAPFREWFTNELIDFSKREAFFLKVCPKTQVLRFFCCLKSGPEDTPTFALCFDVDRKTWWTENYPNSICSAVTARPNIARLNSTIFGAADGHIYELDNNDDHANQTLVRCVVTNGGKGYKRSPTITCPSSKGVQVKGVVSEGRLVDVLILSSGWDCKWGVQLLTEDGKQILSHDSKLIQGVEYAPIVLDVEPPPQGGTQATAIGHYSVTTRLTRDVTVAEGESFVRLRSLVTDPIDSYVPPLITAQDGKLLCANGGSGGTPTLDGVPLQAQPLPVEIGMEAIGDFLPLNCFVSSVVGTDIYLQHPDGTPVVLLGGAARIDANNDGYFEGGGSESVVYFRKAYHTHIPFRLATGAMQLLNETNINRGGDGLIDRSVSLVYSPTASKKEVEIVQYYNDSDTPRANVMRRSRGGPGGFEHRQDSASTVLNLERSSSHLGDATGVASAMFAGRVYTDATGEDQHIQVELHGRPLPANGGSDLVPQRFVMHSLTVNGVIDNGE